MCIHIIESEERFPFYSLIEKERIVLIKANADVCPSIVMGFLFHNPIEITDRACVFAREYWNNSVLEIEVGQSKWETKIAWLKRWNLTLFRREKSVTNEKIENSNGTIRLEIIVDDCFLHLFKDTSITTTTTTDFTAIYFRDSPEIELFHFFIDIVRYEACRQLKIVQEFTLWTTRMRTAALPPFPGLTSGWIPSSSSKQ